MYLVRPNWLMRKTFSSAIWRIMPNSIQPPQKEDSQTAFTSNKKNKSKGEIYLTFDDGPIPEVTPWVLSTLKKYKAKATFFCIGANIEKHPYILQQIIAEGHSIGNHTYNHLNGWKTKTREYLKNVDKCNKAMVDGKELMANGNPPTISPLPSSISPLPLFRPPYGKINLSQYSILKSHYSVVMWDVLSGDFDQTLSEEKCLKNVLTKTRAGSIVVFHDSIKAKKNLLYTLPKFLEYFSKKGFSFSCLTSDEV
jgi:peptidoglycan-N-acetylglucosamine deacetylase